MFAMAVRRDTPISMLRLLMGRSVNIGQRHSCVFPINLVRMISRMSMVISRTLNLTLVARRLGNLFPPLKWCGEPYLSRTGSRPNP